MPSTNQKTIAAVSNPRERHTTKERAPLTQEQKAERREDSARKQADIDAAVRKSLFVFIDAFNATYLFYFRGLVDIHGGKSHGARKAFRQEGAVLSRHFLSRRSTHGQSSQGGQPI
jgi:hypothetical protein